ncbi:MAG: ThiF family adenylyltransferase [Candidatus Thiodiazotropha lotti]
MSAKLINLSPDLKKLQDEGYALEISHGFLSVHDVPYVNNKGEVNVGSLVTDITLNNERTTKPGNHQVWFTGDYPCDKDGRPIEALRNEGRTHSLYDGLTVHHRFSCKPQEGYQDYHQKMTRYVEIISNPARAIDPSVTACIFKPVVSEEEGIFNYTDSASSHYGITALSQKCAMNKVAIVGLGGTGSYILDMLAKTHVQEIHLFDGDDFIQRNAFRAPGAASLTILEQSPKKVEYYTGIYSAMRKGIVPHNMYLEEDNIEELAGYDFVFACVDKPAVRKLLFEFLIEQNIPFIDTGMELEHIKEDQCLIGTCRATLCSPDKNAHLFRHVSIRDAKADDIYDENIQIAEMNVLNATMAILKWKKYCGFYQDLYQEHQSTYSLNTHQLTRDETRLDAAACE